MTCGCNDKCELPKALQINNPGEVTLFHRVDIPASQGDDTTYPPKNGLYRNVLLVYLANNHSYLYNSDGIPTRVDGPAGPGTAAGGETGQVLTKRSDDDYDTIWATPAAVNDATLTISENETPVGTFTANSDTDTTIDITVPTKTSDLENDGATGESTYAEATDINAIWQEIEEIEAASDVTDVVGTYADLEAYDTSKLKDNDIIKVLEDETQNGQITYYRWDTDTDTFTLIGAIGPYYTKSEADTTFQGKLTAGSNITIDANNEISATDTTYTAGEGININGTTIAAKVRRVYNYLTSRPASANLAPTANGGMFTFQATNAMTTGKPKTDGHILQLEWDNDGGWDSQFAVANNSTNMWAAIRAQNAGLWGDWVYLLTDTAGSVKTTNIDALAVTTAKIANGAITEAKINATDWAKKVNVASIDLTGETTTLLSLTKALGANNIDYARWECRTDIGSANISDRPTGGTNASFVCEAYCNRWTASNDYRYQLICWVKENTNPFVAYIANHSSSITWERLRPTVNDATLTIQKNGTTVETFTANSSTNKIANITVPTKTSDLANDGADGTSTYVEADELTPGYITGEGTQITLTNTQGGRFSDVRLKGDTKQTTYSGKNLLNEAGIEQITRSGITVTYNAANSTITINGTATARADFGLPSLPTTEANVSYAFSYWYISGSGTCEFHYQDGSHSWQGYNIDNASTSDRGFSRSFNTSMTFDTKILRVQSGTTCSNLTFHLQFEKSSTVTPYEPYVGGVASPNPDYPQDVNVVAGEQTVKITGKNLFKASAIANSNIVVSNNGQTITMPVVSTGNGLVMSNTTLAGLCPTLAVGDRVYLQMDTTSSVNKYIWLDNSNYLWHPTTAKTITATDLGSNVGLYGNRIDQGETIQVVISNMRIVKERTDGFEPYKEQSYPLSLGSLELCKIGAYQDYIYKSNGTWYLHKEVRHVSLSVSDMNNQENYAGWKDIPNVKADLGVNLNTGLDQVTTVVTNFISTAHALRVNTAVEGTLFLPTYMYPNLTQTQWQTQYPNLVCEIYYGILNQPTDTPITGTLLDDLNAFDQATSYQGDTYITVSSVSPDLPAILSVTTEEKSVLPTATETSAGVVSVGDGLEVTEGGVLSVNPSKKEVYSTEEQVIGTWIDGKPLYRKTVNCGGGPNAGRKDVPAGISNPDKIVNLYGFSIELGTCVPVNNARPDNTSAANGAYFENGNIVIRTGVDRSNATFYITVEYTKTTD